MPPSPLTSDLGGAGPENSECRQTMMRSFRHVGGHGVLYNLVLPAVF